MAKINANYLKLPGSYLFSAIGKKVRDFSAANPEAKIIRLGIGDVTQPIAPAVIDALHGAVDEMGRISAEEIFISDGAKCDCGNIQEIFDTSNKIAVCDPVYPVYVDSNVMAGRTGDYDAQTGRFDKVIYMPCTAENGFVPDLPEEVPDLIYLCFPNNPTGAVMNKAQLQKWVDYANQHDSIIPMMRLMRLIFLSRMCPTVFTSAKVPEGARSNSVLSPRQPVLPVYGSVIR